MDASIVTATATCNIWIVITSKEHSNQICSSYASKCHSCNSMSLLPWQQDFHLNKCNHGLLLSQGICVPNMKHVCFQTAKWCRYCKVCMASSHIMGCCCPKGLAYQQKLHTLSNSKVINIWLCCHGNKCIIVTSYNMGCCCLSGPLYKV